ncbi:MAG: hypothetical protein C5B54_05900 [Acidobacteria bacterium]|nr:MAG: hypothetical protein C5B54_05900 [Acidobacteriota bacterium]
MVGIIRGRDPLTPHFKNVGDIVYLVGKGGEELGGSRYATLDGPLAGPCPALDLELEKRCHDALIQAFEEGHIKSLHDCSDGGLITTLAECCFGDYPNMNGCELSWSGAARPDAFLFGESQTRYILSCRPEGVSRIEAILNQHGLPHTKLGSAGGRQIRIHVNGHELVDLSVEEIYRIWYNSISSFLS